MVVFCNQPLPCLTFLYLPTLSTQHPTQHLVPSSALMICLPLSFPSIVPHYPHPCILPLLQLLSLFLLVLLHRFYCFPKVTTSTICFTALSILLPYIYYCKSSPIFALSPSSHNCPYPYHTPPLPQICPCLTLAPVSPLPTHTPSTPMSPPPTPPTHFTNMGIPPPTNIRPFYSSIRVRPNPTRIFH